MPLPAGEFRRRLRILPVAMVLALGLFGGLSFLEWAVLRASSSFHSLTPLYYVLSSGVKGGLVWHAVHYLLLGKDRPGGAGSA